MYLNILDMESQESVSLIGSCVARDFKEIAFHAVSRSHFLWRSNTISIMSKAETVIDLKDFSMEESEFKTVDRDVNKNYDLYELIDCSKYVVLDYARDYYPVAKLADGRIVTVGQQYEKYQLKSALNEREFISPYSPAYVEIWLNAAKEFAYLANCSKSSLIIVPTILEHGHVDGNKFRVPNDFDAFDVMYKNKLIYFMENIAFLLLKNAYMLPALHAFSKLDLDHLYGVGPVHLHKNLYELRCKLVKISNHQVLWSGGFDESYRMDAVAELQNCWRDFANAGYGI